jgi:hypothetical protein
MERPCRRARTSPTARCTRRCFYTEGCASRSRTTFNAVAEPRRREILTYLAGEEPSVGEIVDM